MLCSDRSRVLLFSIVLGFVASLVACSSKPEAVVPKSAQSVPSTMPAPSLQSADADAAQQRTALALPRNFGRATGDWDEIVKRGYVRALVVYNRGGFYYDNGRPRGMVGDAMHEVEKSHHT